MVTAQLPHSDVPNLFVPFATCYMQHCSLIITACLNHPAPSVSTETVCLIRGKISLVTFWRKQDIWRNSLKILHLTKWMILKIITPALQ